LEKKYSKTQRVTFNEIKSITKSFSGIRKCLVFNDDKIFKFISIINQLDAQNLFYSNFISFQLHYTASGIITPIGVMIPEAV